MITLFRKDSDAEADKIEEKFQDLVLSNKTDKLPPEKQNLYISDSGNIVSGKKDIEQWLLKLSSELKWQRSLSGDGCYIDPDSGEVC